MCGKKASMEQQNSNGLIKNQIMKRKGNTEKTKLGIALCPDCFGDGVETCHNPDHGFLSGFLGAVYGANESACPCCGHSSDHKMKGKCETCKGTGQVSKEEYDKYLDEFVDEDDIGVVDEHCLKNYA